MPKLVIFLLFGFFTYTSHAQTAGFTYQAPNNLFCAPVNIQFTNTSTGNPTGYVWDFGNGQASNQASPSIAFTAGTYTIKLVAVYNGVVAENVQTIRIFPGIIASLTADRNYICTPGVINFTAASTGNIATYNWDFGDGTAVQTTTTPTITHNYSAFGNFTATVTATDISGCPASASYAVSVQRTPITASLSPASGCIPALVGFNASVNVPSGSSVTGYSWDFGDGSPVSTTATNSTTYNYTIVGAYGPTVTVTTSEGCVNTYAFAGIAYGTPPININAYPNKLIYCGSETPVFTATATNANSYLWDFGDGVTVTVPDTSVAHQYATLGSKTVTVTPFFNGCVGAGTSFTVDIVGVIAGFTYSNTCANKTTFSFVDTSQGIVSSYLWDFADGSPQVNSQNAVHSFSANGSFLTSLIVTDTLSACSDTASITIHSGSSTLSNPDTSICRNSSTTFIVNNNQTPVSATYTWNAVGVQLNNFPSREQPIEAIYFGVFNTNYVVIDNGGQYCLDTAYLDHAIKVRGPELDFSGPAIICSGNLYNVTNNSKAYFPGDSVNLWYWNFYLSSTNDTIYQPAPVLYPYAGTFNIKLVAKDSTGCIDSLTKTLLVNPTPFVQIISERDSLCLGQSDSLIAYHSDTLLWSPAGAVPCATCDTIVVNPNVSTQYIATASNSFGCSASDTVSVRVFQPFMAQAGPSPKYICLNDTTTISVSPPGKMVTWSPPAGLSSATLYNPVASPSASTTYTAMLIDSAGCFSSSASVNVIVKSLPTVDAGPDRILPYNSSFTINPFYSANAGSYTWTPVTNLNCSNCPNPIGVALVEQLYVIRVESDSGCVASDSIMINIECKYANLLLPTAFTPNNDFRNDIFYPITRGIRTIKKFMIFNRLGQKMFEANDIKPNDRSFGWNGDYKGQKADPGAYVYMLEAICETGNIVTKKDSFILIR